MLVHTISDACEARQDEPLVAVLLHGFLGDRRDMEPLRRALTTCSTGLSCLSVDLPGHGDSAWLDADAWEERAVEAVLATVNARLPSIARLILVGYSMGGRIALQFASRQPDRVVGVAVLSGSPGIEDEAERRARAERDEQLASRLARMTPPQFESWLRDEWCAQAVPIPALDLYPHYVPYSGVQVCGGAVGRSTIARGVRGDGLSSHGGRGPCSARRLAHS